MKYKQCCAWCWKFCWVDTPPERNQDTVCSEECRQKERWFRTAYSDNAIMAYRRKHASEAQNNQDPNQPPKA
jgi:hypothetical protein